MGEMRNAYNILVKKKKVNGWDLSIDGRIIIGQSGLSMDWIQLAQGTDQRRIL
jgi:hypothetical protein